MTVRARTVAYLGVGIVAASILVASTIGVGVGAQAGSTPVVGVDTRGLHLTAAVPLGALPAQSMYWHIYEFDSRAAAEAARPARGTVAEAFGRHWLDVIAEEGWRTNVGRKVSVVGPFILSTDRSYTALHAGVLPTCRNQRPLRSSRTPAPGTGSVVCRERRPVSRGGREAEGGGLLNGNPPLGHLRFSP